MYRRDIPGVRELCGQSRAIKGRNGGHFLSEEQLGRVIDADNDILLVQKEGRKVIAFVHAEVNKQTTSALVTDFFVEQAWRGRGVREQLMAVLKEELAKKGVTYYSIMAKLSESDQDKKFFSRWGLSAPAYFVLFEGKVGDPLPQPV